MASPASPHLLKSRLKSLNPRPSSPRKSFASSQSRETNEEAASDIDDEVEFAEHWNPRSSTIDHTEGSYFKPFKMTLVDAQGTDTLLGNVSHNLLLHTLHS